MTKIIVKPLTVLFENCISQGIFLDNWKKTSIAPIHRKGDWKIKNIYRPVSLLPICRIILKRLIFNSLYQFLEELNLLSVQQSGFRCNDSCINQLLFIVHTLHKDFHAYPTLDARDVFLEISKTLFGMKFDKVWHEVLIYKLKSHTLLKLIRSFSTDRF